MSTEQNQLWLAQVDPVGAIKACPLAHLHAYRKGERAIRKGKQVGTLRSLRKWRKYVSNVAAISMT
jgi:hypothetical protein